MDPGRNGDVELHKAGEYWHVSLCAGVGSGGVGSSAGVGGADRVVSGSGGGVGGVGSGGGNSDRGGGVGGSSLCFLSDF